ncbi:MAG: DUF3616 domain-containing protein [Gammaproteobacteria bacterium]|nr:DUF3616 domain-containing protein [Gammaproteobacteria bacterium]
MKKQQKRDLENPEGTGSSSEADEPRQAKTKKTKPLGTAKAVDTMFRNAYRAELDIIALAATKANIMISLNGFIISALMISGTFIFATSAAFLLPVGIFLFTSSLSIVFALLAASPEQVDSFGAVLKWAKAVYRREARLGDLRNYVMRGSKSKESDEFNLLIYSDRSSIDQQEYWIRMKKLLRNQNDIYQKMSDQLYWLGLMANRKFKLLNISYTIFRWGLTATILVFIGFRSFFGLFPGFIDDVMPLKNRGISEFENIYEPSAVEQLSDGRLLLVEDEASRAINLLTIADDGSLIEDAFTDLKLTRGFGRRLKDLEGLSADENDYIYAVTSHAKNREGERNSDREQLLRFKIKGNNVGDIYYYTSLTDALQGASKVKAEIKAKTGQEPDFGKLNIEGLAYHKQNKELLLGLRKPTANDMSIIIPISNPAELFDKQTAPVFGKPILLDLKGGGIRGLSYDANLGMFLVVNEIKNQEGNKHSQLWTWGGKTDETAQPLELPHIINMDNVEAIDSIMIHGEPYLLLMSDEGDEKKKRPAKYLILDYEQLSL